MRWIVPTLTVLFALAVFIGTVSLSQRPPAKAGGLPKG